MIRTILILVSLMLVGCSSIPMSTMMHFSDYNKDSFFSLEPTELRVKATIDSGLNFDLHKAINLSASIEDSQGVRVFKFSLELIRVDTTEPVSGMFTDTKAMDIYYFKLTKSAVEDYEKLKMEAQSGGPKKAGFSAGFSATNDNKIEDDNVHLSIALKLSESHEFITLIDNWKIELPNS